jgi:hypothetical protein
MAAGVDGEPRVVGAGRGGVRYVNEVVADGDGDRVCAVRRDDICDRERPVRVDAENRDLVAAGVDGEQVAPVRAELQRALGG